MPQNSNNSQLIQSVSRAVDILRCFAGGKELRLSEIVSMVGLHKSTVAGIVNTLKAEGFLEQDSHTNRMQLGLELFTLAVNARRNLELICEPYLNKLLQLSGETVNLAVLDVDRSEIVYIAKEESTRSVRIGTSVGKRVPIYCTAIGKVIMAFMDSQKASALIDRLDMIPLTERTITDKVLLQAELELILERGYACDDEEFEKEVVCIAAPLCNSYGEPLGAISISGPAMRMDSQERLRIASVLCNEVSKVSMELSRLR